MRDGGIRPIFLTGRAGFWYYYIRFGRKAEVRLSGWGYSKEGLRDTGSVESGVRVSLAPPDGDVAHSGERCVRIAEVRGSNPLISTAFLAGRSGGMADALRSGRSVH